MKHIYTKEELQDVVSNSYSYAECLKKLNIIPAGGNYSTLQRNIEKFGIDTSHFCGKGWTRSPNKQDIVKQSAEKRQPYKIDDVFAEHSLVSQHCLKNFVLRYGVVDYVCSMCGNTGVWNGEKMTLELDHINGDHMDNRIENLRFLCPNCHAITGTYKGKNKKKSVS